MSYDALTKYYVFGRVGWTDRASFSSSGVAQIVVGVAQRKANDGRAFARGLSQLCACCRSSSCNF